MISAFLLALQVASTGVLTVRAGDRVTTVALVETADGRFVRLDQLTVALGATMRTSGDGRHVLTVAGAGIELLEDAPFVRVAADLFPIAIAPRLVAGRLLVPLQIVSDIVPRVATGLLYDPRVPELRAFTATARAGVGLVTGARTDRPASSAGPAVSSGATRPTGRSRRKIVIDAGHGGTDPGTIGPIGPGPRIREKDITLAVARELQRVLVDRGVGVVMTRATDTLIALSDRGRIAGREGGDLFISVHVNAANPNWRDPGRARGFETYFLAEAKTEDARRVERMENEAVRFETRAEAGANDPLSFIINDMAQNEHLRESSELAALIQERLGLMHPGPNRGVKQAGFRVLVTAYMPAVLVEIGFASNPSEAEYISSPVRQRALATAVADAAVEYLARYERRAGTPR